MSIRLSIDSVRDPATLIVALEQETRKVPKIHWFETPFPTLGVAVSVYHKLGTTPVAMVVDAMVDAKCWATAEDRKEWDTQRVVVRCNTSGATMRIGLIV